jgi:hypothetical protein
VGDGPGLSQVRVVLFAVCFACMYVCMYVCMCDGRGGYSSSYP